MHTLQKEVIMTVGKGKWVVIVGLQQIKETTGTIGMYGSAIFSLVTFTGKFNEEFSTHTHTHTHSWYAAAAGRG